MEPISQLNPLIQMAFLGFSLLTGGPPMMVAQSAALAAAQAGKAPAQVATEAPAPLVAPTPTPAPTAPAAPAAPQTATLKGIAAWGALVGNTVSGKSDDDDMFEFYAPNGKVKQMVGDEKATGKWALKGQTVCFDYDNGDGETCYTITVTGNQAVFTDEDDTETTYTILAGNPKKL